MSQEAVVETLDESASAPKRRRPARYLLIGLALSVYFVAVWIIGWRKVGGALAHADLGLVLVAAVLTGAGALTRMWKWRRALGAERHALGVYFLSRSAGVWSPARVGEFLPLLWKRHRNTRVAGWILFDRVLEVFVTLAFGLVGLAFAPMMPAGAYAAVASVTIAASALGLYLLTRRDLLDAIALRWAEGSRIRASLSALAATSGELRSFLGRPVDLTVLTVVAKACDLYAVVLIFRALGVGVGFGLVAASKCALAIVSFVPITPMATGVPHAVQGWMMLKSAGVQPDTIVASVGIEAGIMCLVFSITWAAASRAIKQAAL
jgi:hypothetical protein